MIIYIYTIRKVPEGVGLKTGWNQYWLGRPAKPYNEGPIASLRGDDIDVTREESFDTRERVDDVFIL